MTQDKHKIPRVLFIGDTFPPFISGSVTLMYNLLLGLDTSESILVTQSSKGFSLSAANGLDKSVDSNLIRRVEIDGISKFWAKGFRWGFPAAAMLPQIPKIIKAGVKAGRDIEAQIVMSCWPNDHFITAAWQVAERLKIPFVVYLHDLWLESRYTSLQLLMARYLEPRILKKADLILVISEPTKQYLYNAKGLESEVLEHSVNSNIWPLDEEIKRINSKPKNITMLGAVNKFNRDSVVAFSEAIAKIPGLNLTILTSQTKDQLEKLNVNCSAIETLFVYRDKLISTILKADILYLALGFNTPVPKEVEVVIPTRLMDYLPSGIPILAHGPKNSWTMEEAVNKGWGYVIDTLDIDSIVISLREFISKTDHQVYILNAHKEAKRRDFKKISKRFADLLINTIRK